MKKFFLVILAVLGTLMTIQGQSWKGYRVVLPSDMYLGDVQYHYSDGAMVSTNKRNVYLWVDECGDSEFVRIPKDRDIVYLNAPNGVWDIDIYPYAKGYNGCFFVETNRGDYVVSKSGRWSRTYEEYYGSRYKYSIPYRAREYDFGVWHFGPRYKSPYHHNDRNDRYDKDNHIHHHHHDHGRDRYDDKDKWDKKGKNEKYKKAPSSEKYKRENNGKFPEKK